MCLQWCHATNQLIDNDLPCDHCALARALRPDQRCDSCRHRVDRVGKPPMCRLTHMGLPLAGGCCHANVTPLVSEDNVIWISVDEVAPGLMQRRRVTSVAALFDRSESAPEYGTGPGGQIRVTLADLAVPEIYGVPSSGWDAALGRERKAYDWTPEAEAIATGPRYGDIVMPLIEDIGTALEAGTPSAAQRANLLARARGLPPLPERWATIVNEAIALLEEELA
jgi:hypothetical protein